VPQAQGGAALAEYADVSYGLSIKSFLTDGECLPAEDFVDKIQAPEEIVMRARRMVERLNDPG
jgi:hypothetical protein